MRRNGAIGDREAVLGNRRSIPRCDVRAHRRVRVDGDDTKTLGEVELRILADIHTDIENQIVFPPGAV